MVFTAERVHESSENDAPVFYRQLFAYLEVEKYIHGDVLEVGCGDGYGTKRLIDKANSYTGIDKFVSQTVTQLKNLNFIQMNIPPFTGLKDNSFDVVISFQVIEHIQNDALYMEEIRRVLKPGGKFIFSTPNKKMSLTRNPYHIREYILSDYTKLCSKYSSYELQGVFGDQKVMDYYQKNKESVKKITRWDILNLQYNLPRFLLKIPYDLANSFNRKKLAENNTELTHGITAENYFIAPATENCLDFFCIAVK